MCGIVLSVMSVRATKSQRQVQGKQTDLHPAVIVARLRIAGWSLRRLSIAHGLRPSTLADALRRPWPKGEQIIARALRCSPKELWPSRFVERAARRGRKLKRA